MAAFHEGLKLVGYIEGQNVAIEYRWPEGHYDRLPILAADLVRRQVAVIAAVGGEPSPLAAKAATATIPIVFSLGTDPVRLGLVSSLNRPRGNMTGVYFLQSELGAKRLGLLHDLLPNAAVIGMLVNPNFAESEFHAKEAQEVARSLGIQIHVMRASTVGEFDTAFSILVQQRAGSLFHANDAFFISERRRLIALAARHGPPTMYPWREFVVDGGLMSYSPSLVQAHRLAGEYAEFPRERPDAVFIGNDAFAMPQMIAAIPFGQFTALRADSLAWPYNCEICPQVELSPSDIKIVTPDTLGKCLIRDRAGEAMHGRTSVRLLPIG